MKLMGRDMGEWKRCPLEDALFSNTLPDYTPGRLSAEDRRKLYRRVMRENRKNRHK